MSDDDLVYLRAGDGGEILRAAELPPEAVPDDDNPRKTINNVGSADPAGPLPEPKTLRAFKLP